MRLKDAKQAFAERYDGQASREQVEQAWSSQLPGAKNIISNELDGSISKVSSSSGIQGVISGTHARGVDLVEQATMDLTRGYAEQNREQFYSQKLGAGMSIKAIDNAWKENVEGYRNNVFEMATNTLQDLSGGQSQYAFIDKNQFGQGLAFRRVEVARNEFSQQFAGASPEFIEKQWERSGIESK